MLQAFTTDMQSEGSLHLEAGEVRGRASSRNAKGPSGKLTAGQAGVEEDGTDGSPRSWNENFYSKAHGAAITGSIYAFTTLWRCTNARRRRYDVSQTKRMCGSEAAHDGRGSTS